MLPIVFTGDIANFTSDIENKYNSLPLNIAIEDDRITFTCSVDIDIYDSIDGKLLTLMFIIKKGKLNDEIKVVTININNIQTYTLLVLPRGPTSINKHVKKSSLENIIAINSNLSLFKIQQHTKHLLLVDSNGFVQVYPDNLEIYDNTNIKTFLKNENITNISETNLENKDNINNINDLNQIIESCGYTLLDTTMQDSSYNLENINIPNIQPIQNNLQSGNQSSIISTIGNIINWLNPLSYYSTLPDNIVPVNNDIAKPKYYINFNNNKIIKYYENKIKILKPLSLNIPSYIEKITFDDNDNITFITSYNKIDKPISIMFNKFFLNPQFKIISC